MFWKTISNAIFYIEEGRGKEENRISTLTAIQAKGRL